MSSLSIFESSSSIFDVRAGERQSGAECYAGGMSRSVRATTATILSYPARMSSCTGLLIIVSTFQYIWDLGQGAADARATAEMDEGQVRSGRVRIARRAECTAAVQNTTIIFVSVFFFHHFLADYICSPCYKENEYVHRGTTHDRHL